MKKVPAHAMQMIESQPEMFADVLDLAYTKLMQTPRGKVTPELNQLSVFLTRLCNVMDTADEPLYSGNWFWLYDLLHDMAFMYYEWEWAKDNECPVNLSPSKFNFLNEPKEGYDDFIDYVMAFYPTNTFAWGVA